MQRSKNAQSWRLTSFRRIQCLKTTPIGPLMSEECLTPATVLLDHRQRTYADRIAGLPKDQWVRHIVPNEIQDPNNNQDHDSSYQPTRTKTRKTNGGIRNHLGKIIQKSLANNKSGIEPVVRSNYTMRGLFTIKNKTTAIEEATKASLTNNILFTDGSRLENGNAGCSVLWRTMDRSWRAHKTHLGTNKELLDAELFAIAEALKLANQKVIGNHTTHTISIFTDFSAALLRIQEDSPGPVQWITKTIIEMEGPYGEQIGAPNTTGCQDTKRSKETKRETKQPKMPPETQNH